MVLRAQPAPHTETSEFRRTLGRRGYLCTSRAMRGTCVMRSMDVGNQPLSDRLELHRWRDHARAYTLDQQPRVSTRMPRGRGGCHGYRVVALDAGGVLDCTVTVCG